MGSQELRYIGGLVPVQLHTAARVESVSSGLSVTEIMRRALGEYLAKCSGRLPETGVPYELPDSTAERLAAKYARRK